MNILVICSKSFYDKINEVKTMLEEKGNIVYLPNCYDKPNTENKIKMLGKEQHAKFKAEMFKQSEETISKMDAVLVLNFEKNGVQGYIGGATFLEMYDAFRLGKQIYMYNDIPSGILEDEIKGFSPIIINGNINNI